MEKREETIEETVQRFVDAGFRAMEKQRRKKYLRDDLNLMYLCPECEAMLFAGQHYCCHCGQHIEWAD